LDEKTLSYKLYFHYIIILKIDFCFNKHINYTCKKKHINYNVWLEQDYADFFFLTIGLH